MTATAMTSGVVAYASRKRPSRDVSRYVPHGERLARSLRLAAAMVNGDGDSVHILLTTEYAGSWYRSHTSPHLLPSSEDSLWSSEYAGGR